MPGFYNNTVVTSSTGTFRLECMNSAQCSAQRGRGSQCWNLETGRIPFRKPSHWRAEAAKYPKAGNPLICSRHSQSYSRVLKSRASSVGSSSTPHVQPAQDFTIWIQTLNQAVLTVALENGVTTFLFPRELLDLAESWRRLGKMSCMFSDGDILLDSRMEVAGSICKVTRGEDVKAAEAECERCDYVVMDALDWKIIPAENLVAAFQGKRAKLFAMAKSAQDARVMLEALESGTHGVVLRTEDPAEVRKLADYVRERRDSSVARLTYELAKIVRVQAVGLGDRVCVDLCSLVEAGAGLLVGSFARTLFLVQAECDDTLYLNSRPFRINAGPVHSYVAVPGGRTAYLSELRSGSEVLVADAAGRTRTALVGRCKIERRPMVLVEAETSDGQRHSLMLQNAETVKLMGFKAGPSGVLRGPDGTLVPPVPPSIVQGADGASAMVLSPEERLAQAAAAARSWAMNSQEDDSEDNADELYWKEATASAPATSTERAPGEAGPDGNEPPLPRPQRLTRSESNLLEWVMHDRPRRASDAASAPSTLGEAPGPAPPGAPAAPDPEPAPAQSVSVGMVEEVEAGREGKLGAGAGSNGETVQSQAVQSPAVQSRTTQAGPRRLSRQNSRVLQWVMREQGATLDSQDLFETLDLDELGRSRSFRRQRSGAEPRADVAAAADFADGIPAESRASEEQPAPSQSGGTLGDPAGPAQAVSVTELQTGQAVLVLRQAAARHAGIGVIGIRILEC